MRLATLLIVAALGVSCGSSPTAPTPTPTPAPTNIAGNWAGTFTFTPIGGGQRLIIAATATFTQAEASVTGQINLSASQRVTIAGTMGVGTLTATATYLADTCTGTASVSGTASNSLIRFAVPAMAGNCNFFTDGEFVLNR